MAANIGINLLVLLPPGHLADIVRTLSKRSYATIYKLSTVTRYALLDDMKNKNVKLTDLEFPLMDFPVLNADIIDKFAQEHEEVFEHYLDMLFNNTLQLYHEDVTETLYSLTGLEFNLYRKDKDKRFLEKLSIVMREVCRYVVTYIKTKHVESSLEIAEVPLTSVITNFRQKIKVSCGRITSRLARYMPHIHNTPLKHVARFFPIYMYFVLKDLINDGDLDKFVLRLVPDQLNISRSLITHRDRRHTLNNIMYSLIYMLTLVNSNTETVDYTKPIPRALIEKLAKEKM